VRDRLVDCDSYLDNRGGKAFTVKIREQAVVSSSFEMPNLLMALLLIATLAVAVLEGRAPPRMNAG
jgi:hypothetical protein